MNSFAILKGEKYTYVNKIKNIITNETAVLCKDECGNFCFCSTEEWFKNRAVEINTADKPQVNKYSTPQQKIELFKSLFCGRADVYAKRYYNTKTGKSGYVPACSNEWVNFVCDKKKYTCSKCLDGAPHFSRHIGFVRGFIVNRREKKSRHRRDCSSPLQQHHTRS